MRTIAKAAIGAVLGAAALALAGFAYFALVFGWPPPDCGSGSPAVARARLLSGAQLSRLYDEMSELAAQDMGAHSIPEERWPPTVASLQPRNVSADFSPRVTIEGCFDHFVFLRFEGVPGSIGNQDPGVTLIWGEGPTGGSEVLWQP